MTKTLFFSLLVLSLNSFAEVDPFIYQIFSERTEGAYKTLNCPAFDDYTYGFGEYAQIFIENGKLKVNVIGDGSTCRSRIVSTFSFGSNESKFIRLTSGPILQKITNTKTKHSIGILKDGNLRFEKLISGESFKESCELQMIPQEDLPDVDDLGSCE